ncbi:MAG: TolC family protein [Candidatus Kapaibacterium sp.]|jgi:outer membrane protein TolC
MKPSVVFLALIASTCSMIVHAQTVSLSLEEAVSNAVASSRTLKISRSKVNQAQAREDEAQANRLPSLRFQGTYNRLNDVGPVQFDNPFVPGSKIVLSDPILNSYQLNLSASQVVFAGFRLDAAKDIADLAVQAARLDEQSDEISVRFAATTTYWSLYKLMEFKNALGKTVRQLNARVRDAELLFKAGTLNSNDVLKIKVQAANVRAQELEITQQVTSVAVALNNLMGRPLTTIPNLSSQPMWTETDATSVQDAITKAREDRPDIRATQLRVKAAERGADAANGGWWPQVAVTATYLYANPNQRIFPNRPQFDGTWAVGVSAGWDLWNWMIPTHQAAQAHAQAAQLQEGLLMMQDGITVEAMQNYMALAPARERIAVAEQAEAQAKENSTNVTSKFTAGAATGTDVLESEAMLLQASANKTTAIVDYEIAWAKLQRSLGK